MVMVSSRTPFFSVWGLGAKPANLCACYLFCKDSRKMKENWQVTGALKTEQYEGEAMRLQLMAFLASLVPIHLQASSL